MKPGRSTVFAGSLMISLIVLIVLLAIAVYNGSPIASRDIGADQNLQALPSLGASGPSLGASGPLSDQIKGMMFDSMDSAAAEVAQYANQSGMSETDMIKFNMAASRYNMMTNLTSQLVKELTDNEKAIAQKM